MRIIPEEMALGILSSGIYFWRSEQGGIIFFILQCSEYVWIVSINIYSSPFEENTLSGWTSVFCLYTIAASIYAIISISTMVFFLATGWYFEACTHHFQTFFGEMGEIGHKNRNFEVGLKLKDSLIKAINFHNSTKRYKFSLGFRHYIHRLQYNDCLSEYLNWRKP